MDLNPAVNIILKSLSVVVITFTLCFLQASFLFFLVKGKKLFTKQGSIDVLTYNLMQVGLLLIVAGFFVIQVGSDISGVIIGLTGWIMLLLIFQHPFKNSFIFTEFKKVYR